MTVPIVAIAASAGGLEALSELLGALPAACGLACIVVQHLDPDHESLLADILAKKTSLPVMPAHDGVVAITPGQLGYLLEGIDWRHPQQTWRPQAAG